MQDSISFKDDTYVRMLVVSTVFFGIGTVDNTSWCFSRVYLHIHKNIHHFRTSFSVLPLVLIHFLQEMHPSRLSPASPYMTRTSPIRHGKRFGSLSVPEEHREAALKNGSIYLSSLSHCMEHSVHSCIATGLVFSTLTPFICMHRRRTREGWSSANS